MSEQKTSNEQETREYNPSFHVTFFKGVFVFAMNKQMAEDLAYYLEEDAERDTEVEQFRHAMLGKPVRVADEKGLVIASLRFNWVLNVSLNRNFVEKLRAILASFSELPPHLYALGERIDQRLSYVQDYPATGTAG